MSIFIAPHAKEYSVVDPIQPALDEDIIVNDSLSEKLLNKIKNATEIIENEFDLNIDKVWIVGSSLTYQWTPQSDLDVTLFISKDHENKLKDLNKILHNKFNEKLFEGNHPINFHFFAGSYYKFKADAIFDVMNDKWIKKPEAVSEDEIEDLIRNCASLKEFQDILTEYNKLKNLLEKYSGKPNQLQEILEQTFYVSNLYNDIRNVRREEFKKKPTKDLPSANYRCSNIIFKLLEQYGLGDLAKQISDFFELRLEH